MHLLDLWWLLVSRTDGAIGRADVLPEQAPSLRFKWASAVRASKCVEVKRLLDAAGRMR